MGDYLSSDGSEIRDVMGEDWWHDVTDRDSDGTTEDDKVTRAISSAESEFNTHAKNNYPIPDLIALDPTPAIVVDVCVDLAVHAMVYPDEGRLTDAIRQRYEDRVKWLVLLGADKVKLPIPDTPDALGDGRAARQTSNERRVTRTTMARL